MKNFYVTPHITFFEATRTSHKDLLHRNRLLGIELLPRITLTCQLLEGARHHALGDEKMKINCILRGPAVNDRTVGAWKRSQHRKAEAGDWRPLATRDHNIIKAAYLMTKEWLISDRVMFGQLIFESMRYGDRIATWIHLSQGHPFRPIKRCGEILEKPHDGPYKMVRKVPIYDLWKNI